MKVRSILTMELIDFCKSQGWDYMDTLDAIHNSDISFGNNCDTLVSVERLCTLCDKGSIENIGDRYESKDVMISLGC